jgi:uracil-DNA glycosylase
VTAVTAARRRDLLAATAAEAAECTRCDLHRRRATQTVFGAGKVNAAVMLVGEQPGDREDREGHPFVGPAGRLLDDALTDAGLDPRAVYRTNAVKHFKWEERGKRRIHERPSGSEMEACHAWLERELELVRPRVVVCLGVTAARAVLGRPTTIGAARGKVLEGPDGLPVVVTIHPSAVLRSREDRAKARSGLVADLALARTRSETTRTTRRS